MPRNSGKLFLIDDGCNLKNAFILDFEIIFVFRFSIFPKIYFVLGEKGIYPGPLSCFLFVGLDGVCFVKSKRL